MRILICDETNQAYNPEPKECCTLLTKKYWLTIHFHRYKHKRDSHCTQENPTDWVVLAPTGVVTFPVVTWWKEYSQAPIEECYCPFVARSWNPSLEEAK